MRAEDICRVESEAGVLATLVYHPDYIYFSENLLPEHFTNAENRAIYTGILKLVSNEAKTIDAFGVLEALRSDPDTEASADLLTMEQLNDFFDNSQHIARSTPEDYKICASNVMNAALRRWMLQSLKKCERMCKDEGIDDVEQAVYRVLDDVTVKFSAAASVPAFSDVVDKCWTEIQSRQSAGYAGIPFKFPALNEYATIERGELFIFGAEQKQGKSMMLLNCAVDLLKQNYAVLYLDSELNTRLFTARIIAHLTGIEYKRLTSGRYTPEEKEKIDEAITWLKTRKFTHIYIPSFDQQSIYLTVKKVKHSQGIDVLIVDYFKGKSEGDAFDSYQELGRFVDLIKNQICGALNIAGIGAAQATATGKLADSAKIARNASTIAMITKKTQEEIDEDGAACGNKKLTIAFNRNGMQMADGEYIDLNFDGNHILYEQAVQHIPRAPY